MKKKKKGDGFVCTHFYVFDMLNPNMVIKILNFEICWKSWNILACCLHLTSMYTFST